MTDKQNVLVSQLALLNLQLGRYLNNHVRKDDVLDKEKSDFIAELVNEIVKTSTAISGSV